MTVEEAVGPAEFTRLLFERGELARVRGPLKRVKTKGVAPRIAFMKDATVRGALRWLIRSGGWRVRHVVAGKRRREGRIWTQGIWEPLDVRYSAATLELLASVAKGEPPAVAPTTTGDLLVQHLVTDALLHARPLPEDEKERNAETARRRALLALSPLTALFRGDELGEKDDFAKLYGPLVQGDRAVLLTYLDDALAVRWVERETSRRALPAPDAGARYVVFATALEGLAAAAKKAARPDALRPLLRFFERYLLRFGQREAVVAGFRNHSMTLVRASDRARFLGQVARLFAVSRGIASEAERILGLPFVDRTEEEKVFIADVSEFSRSIHPELEAIRRELAGEIG